MNDFFCYKHTDILSLQTVQKQTLQFMGVFGKLATLRAQDADVEGNREF